MEPRPKGATMLSLLPEYIIPYDIIVHHDIFVQINVIPLVKRLYLDAIRSIIYLVYGNIII